LQQELDNLQNEKRDLREKLRNSEKKNIIAGLVNRQQLNESTSGSSNAGGNTSYSSGGMQAANSSGGGDTFPLIYEVAVY
jgi:hypothetical protein